jgi:4-hydroxybenzoate polyprenyltransferase
VYPISQRLLPVLQLTRMALVFTALADSGCALLLWAAHESAENGLSMWKQLEASQCIAMGLLSIGLYGFGMSLNDIIDRRRDRQMSPSRPIPSGRIGLATAHVVCAILALLALVCGEIYSTGVWGLRISLVLVVFTMALITFYDFAGKYLVAPGLITLGLIRFFHETIAAPSLPVLWHPLFLLNHVTILSAVAYQWEQKRPVLKPVHKWSVYSGLAGLDCLAIGLVWWRRHTRDRLAPVKVILSIRPELLIPIAAAIVFVGVAIWIRKRNSNPRDAGQALMLAGLLWLIVYDSSFALAYAGWLPGLLVLLLLPVAYMSVMVMRWWSKLMVLSQRPAFKRVET